MLFARARICVGPRQPRHTCKRERDTQRDQEQEHGQGLRRRVWLPCQVSVESASTSQRPRLTETSPSTAWPCHATSESADKDDDGGCVGLMICPNLAESAPARRFAPLFPLSRPARAVVLPRFNAISDVKTAQRYAPTLLLLLQLYCTLCLHLEIPCPVPYAFCRPTRRPPMSACAFVTAPCHARGRQRLRACHVQRVHGPAGPPRGASSIRPTRGRAQARVRAPTRRLDSIDMSEYKSPSLLTGIQSFASFFRLLIDGRPHRRFPHLGFLRDKKDATAH